MWNQLLIKPKSGAEFRTEFQNFWPAFPPSDQKIPDGAYFFALGFRLLLLLGDLLGRFLNVVSQLQPCFGP